MHKKLLSMLVLSILVASTLVGCGGGGSPCPSTLTILSITEGDVSVMKAGTDSWTEADVGIELEVGDNIKTGDDSGAEITFFDGSTMELEAGTEIEIISLDLACDTGVTTITLMQTIGTTISRVTKLLDPASSYEVETPTGVAVVRGSMLIVQVIFGNVNYEDGTTLFTNLGGNIWGSAQGVELQIPEGQTCIIIPDQLPNLIPLAEDDAAITDEDNPVTVAAPGVLSNDSDSDGDTLTVTAVNTSGTVGNVTAWGADGSFTYDPDGQFEYLPAGSSTTDSFTYTVSDGNGGNDTATVTITITGVNDLPVAVNDSATTNENTPVTINVLNNDYDIDGDILTVDSVTQGTNGSVTNNGSNVTYIPALNFTGTDSFNYTISDGNGGTAIANVTVNIPTYGIRVQLTWNTNGTDLDAHLIRPSGQYWAIPDDCHWRNANPNWGLIEVTEDNPSLDQDDVNGYGPENITLEQPYEQGIYQYTVHYYSDRGYGPSTATVRVWINDVEVAEYSKEMSNNEVWNCCSIEWPSGQVTLIQE